MSNRGVTIRYNITSGNMNNQDWQNNYNQMMNNFNNWMNNLNNNMNNRNQNSNNSNSGPRVYHFNFNNMMDNLNDFNFNYSYEVNDVIRESRNNASIRSSRNNLTSSINNSVNLNDFSGGEKKKLQLILEMDEYQYKHIQKYDDSRKETNCAICLEDFKNTDIIKAFCTCKHIFHKKCLLNWLKDHDICPLCKHDLNDDMREL